MVSVPAIVCIYIYIHTHYITKKTRTKLRQKITLATGGMKHNQVGALKDIKPIDDTKTCSKNTLDGSFRHFHLKGLTLKKKKNFIWTTSHCFDSSSSI